MTDATQQITYQILSYLAEKPDARDTLKGISEWWLSEHPGRPKAAEVKEALRSLVADGLVVTIPPAGTQPYEGAQTYYKVNRERLEEIKTLLTRFRSPDPPDA